MNIRRRVELAPFQIQAPYEVFYIHSMLFNTTSAVKSMERLREILATVGLSADSI